MNVQLQPRWLLTPITTTVDAIPVSTQMLFQAASYGALNVPRTGWIGRAVSGEG